MWTVASENGAGKSTVGIYQVAVGQLGCLLITLVRGLERRLRQIVVQRASLRVPRSSCFDFHTFSLPRHTLRTKSGGQRKQTANYRFLLICNERTERTAPLLHISRQLARRMCGKFHQPAGKPAITKHGRSQSGCRCNSRLKVSAGTGIAVSKKRQNETMDINNYFCRSEHLKSSLFFQSHRGTRNSYSHRQAAVRGSGRIGVTVAVKDNRDILEILKRI